MWRRHAKTGRAAISGETETAAGSAWDGLPSVVCPPVVIHAVRASAALEVQELRVA